MTRETVLMSPKIAATKSNLKKPISPQFNPPIITKMNAIKPMDFIVFVKLTNLLDLYHVESLYHLSISANKKGEKFSLLFLINLFFDSEQNSVQFFVDVLERVESYPSFINSLPNQSGQIYENGSS